jgi:hypothetical protein
MKLKDLRRLIAINDKGPIPDGVKEMMTCPPETGPGDELE